MDPPKKRRICPSTSPSSPDFNQQLIQKMAEQIEALTKKTDMLPQEIKAQIDGGQMKMMQNFRKEVPEMIQIQMSKMDMQFQSQATILQDLTNDMQAIKKKSYIEAVPFKPKRFTLRHTFKSVSRLIDRSETVMSKTFNHFGVDWWMAAQFGDKHLGLFLESSVEEGDNWSITLQKKAFVARPTGSRHLIQSKEEVVFTPADDYGGWPEFMKTRKLSRRIKDNEVTIEMTVEIKKMTGVATTKPRCFDLEEFGDVVLTVDGQDFHVLKKFLGPRSEYFNILFFSSNFEESGKKQITLPLVDIEDFQSFLELAHGKPCLEDTNIEGVLHLCDFYIAHDAIAQCEKFLLFESQIKWCKKFQMACKYELVALAEKLMAHLQSTDDVKVVAQNKMSSVIRKVLMKKQTELHEEELAGRRRPDYSNSTPGYF